MKKKKKLTAKSLVFQPMFRHRVEKQKKGKGSFIRVKYKYKPSYARFFYACV